MHILAAPAVFNFKVVVHAFKSVVQPDGAGQIDSAKILNILKTKSWGPERRTWPSKKAEYDGPGRKSRVTCSKSLASRSGTNLFLR